VTSPSASSVMVIDAAKLLEDADVDEDDVFKALVL
jgi:hypothetical protein